MGLESTTKKLSLAGIDDRLTRAEDAIEELRMRTRSMKFEQDVVTLQNDLDNLRSVVSELREKIELTPSVFR